MLLLAAPLDADGLAELAAAGPLPTSDVKAPSFESEVLEIVMPDEFAHPPDPPVGPVPLTKLTYAHCRLNY
jgi:hypothetical protein